MFLFNVSLSLEQPMQQVSLLSDRKAKRMEEKGAQQGEPHDQGRPAMRLYCIRQASRRLVLLHFYHSPLEAQFESWKRKPNASKHA